ncbi:biopolymer transporter ExbD [candidate division WOR-3 bacterium]|nr:biopolymer transporter ExbD [candidate division WOR-3 bacterium]
MALNLRRRGQAGSAPNIPTASCGDIAFLIIIFFMTTSIFGREKGLKIVLPTGESKIKSENVLPVAVNQSGQVLVGGDPNPVNLMDVSGLVAEKLRANTQLAIALRVNRRAPYQTMIETFDQLRLAFKTAGIEQERISLVPVHEEAGGQP